MTRTPYILACALLTCVALFGSGCSNKSDAPGNTAQTGQEQTQPSANTPPPAVQDVSTDALIKIDPDIRKYADEVATARAAFDRTNNTQTRNALVASYIRFGDYMQYESPVSPRKGKYRRALMEYRHALRLDPANDKVQREIGQIEEIYRSMNRPIPADDEV